MKCNDLREAMRRHMWLLALFGAVHTLIFLVLFTAVYEQPHPSTGLYFHYASQILDGQVPYRDFSIEYPPLSLLIFLLPRLIASSAEGYATAFLVQTLLFNLIGLLLITLISVRTELALWKALTMYAVGLLAIGPIILMRYDVFPAVAVLLSLYALIAGKPKTSWVLLAITTLTKLYAVALLPVFMLHQFRSSGNARIRSAVTTFAVTILAILTSFLIISPGGLIDSFTYHSERGLHIESTYSPFLIVASQWRWVTIESEFGYGSWNLVGPGADVLAQASIVIVPLALVAAYWVVYRRIMASSPSPSNLAACSLLVIAVVIATSKVFSPEYLIWLLPLLPLLSGRTRYPVWAVFIAICVLTYYIYPLHYQELIRLSPEIGVVLLVRNLLVIGLAVVLAVVQLRMPVQDQSVPPT